MKIIKEDVLAAKTPWVIRARIAIYHTKIKRAELIFDRVDKIPFQDEVGWTAEELQTLQEKFAAWKKANGE